MAKQPTPADYKKLLEEASKKAAEMEKDPRLKAFMEQAKKMAAQPVNTPGSDNTQQPAVVANSEMLRPDSRYLPVRNNLLLSQLPKKPLTSNELKAYLFTLDAQLTQKLKTAVADSAKEIAGNLRNDGEKIAYTAMVAWYKNDVELAVMLAAKAAVLSADNNTVLSNCAAVLVVAGLGNKAIPILQVLLQREPGSSTVLNNTGQAYTSLGELDTAMYYFGRCIKIAPEHPEANSTAAVVCLKRGQIDQAKVYCIQSVKGGLTNAGINSYGHLFKESNIEKLIDPGSWKIYPFNENDFTFPEQCEKVVDAARIQAELNACKIRYKTFFDKYDKTHNAELRSKAAVLGARYAQHPAENQWMVNSTTVYTRRAAFVYHRLITGLLDDINALVLKHTAQVADLKAEYAAKQRELVTKRNGDIIACAHSNLCEVKLQATHCRQQNELANQYLPKFAVINRDYVSKRWRMAKESFQANSNMQKMGVKHNTLPYYAQETGRIGFISAPLTNGEILNDGYQVIKPYCDMTAAEMQAIDSLELKENTNCGINVEIPLGLVKMSFSCDEFEIEGGELVKGKFTKNFTSGQSTVYAGVGGSVAIPGFEAGATQYIYVCFDGNNQPVDLGTQGELELDVKGVVKGDQKMVLRSSLNAGISYDQGPLKGLSDMLPYTFK
jgi:tetratricopeptide (TPR) repeat protein